MSAILLRRGILLRNQQRKNCLVFLVIWKPTRFRFRSYTIVTSCYGLGTSCLRDAMRPNTKLLPVGECFRCCSIYATACSFFSGGFSLETLGVHWPPWSEITGMTLASAVDDADILQPLTTTAAASGIIPPVYCSSERQTHYRLQYSRTAVRPKSGNRRKRRRKRAFWHGTNETHI